MVNSSRMLLIGGEDKSSCDLMRHAVSELYDKHKGANAALYGGLGYLILIATAANCAAVYAMELGRNAQLTPIIDKFEVRIRCPSHTACACSSLAGRLQRMLIIIYQDGVRTRTCISLIIMMSSMMSCS